MPVRVPHPHYFINRKPLTWFVFASLCSRRSRQDNQRPGQAHPRQPRPQLVGIHHHHRHSGDSRQWGHRHGYPGRCEVSRECTGPRGPDHLRTSNPTLILPHLLSQLDTDITKKHGRLDVLIYNSGAIYWAPVSSTPLKRFRLMQSVNPEGLYATLQSALPHLRQSPAGCGRVVVVSPPIYSRFFRGKTAYAMGKVGMSVLTKGLAMDFEREASSVAAGGREGEGGAMSITSIWPAVAIESAATEQFTKTNPDEAKDLRKATIFSDAILAILQSPPSLVNGELLLDEDFLRDTTGKTDFSEYNVVPGSSPRRIMPQTLPDLTVAEQADEGKRYDSSSKSKL